MLARLLCFLLGHSYDELDVREGPQQHIRVVYGKCARCGAPVIEIHDLSDDEDSDTLDGS
jgi:hypothetical protein